MLVKFQNTYNDVVYNFKLKCCMQANKFYSTGNVNLNLPGKTFVHQFASFNPRIL